MDKVTSPEPASLAMFFLCATLVPKIAVTALTSPYTVNIFLFFSKQLYYNYRLLIKICLLRWSYSQPCHHFNKVCSLHSYLRSVGLFPKEIDFTWSCYGLAGRC